MALFRSIVAIVLLGGAPVAPAFALRQESPVVSDSARPYFAPGSRIRLQVPGYGRGLFRTTIVGLSAGTLRIRTHPKTPVSSIPIDSIVRLQVENGSQSRVAHWGLRGLAFGTSLGGFMGLATGHLNDGTCPISNPDCPPDQGFQHGLHLMGYGALFGGLIGGGLGAVIGSRMHTLRWRDVPPSEMRIHLQAEPGRAWGLGLSASF